MEPPTFSDLRRHPGYPVKVGSFAIGAALAGPVVVELGARGALVLTAFVQFAAAGTGWLVSKDLGRADAVHEPPRETATRSG